MTKTTIMKLIKQNYKIILFCLIISAIILIFTSCNSPLYPHNFSPDINAYFTIGRGWLEGKIPYKDLFDQKGPILYIIYMFAAAISNKSFVGIYILEVINMTIVLYYANKIITLFVDKKNSLFVLPILATLICTSFAFASGATAEEFTLSLFMISIYYLIKYFKEERITYKQLFLNGLIAGIILMIKFNIAFFWAGFIICIFIDLILKKNIKEAFKSSLFYFLGMIIPFAIFNIYFLAVGAIKDFYEAYFYFNLFAYNERISIISKFEQSINNFIYRCIENGTIILPLFICFLCFTQNIKIKNKYKAMIYIIFILTIFGIFFGANYHYYILPLFSFLIFSLIAICILFQKVIKKIFKNKIILITFTIIFYVGIFTFSYKGANFNSQINTKIKDYGIYEIIKEINNSNDKTVLNYGKLDNGIYNLSNTIPNIKYFFKLNVDDTKYPKIIQEQQKYITNKKTNYILLTNVQNNDPVFKIMKNKYKFVKETTNIYTNPDYSLDIKTFKLYKRT